MAKTNFENKHPKTIAQDVMSTELVVIKPEQTYRTAVELLTQKKLTVLPVVGGDGKLKGLLSEKDVLLACASFEQIPPGFLDDPIHYKKKVPVVYLDTSIDELGTILANESYRHLPVVDADGFLKGIITRRDLIRVIYLRLELSRNKEASLEI